MTATGETFAKYECSRCGLLTERHRLKVKRHWVATGKTSGGTSRIYEIERGRVVDRQTGYVQQGDKINYKAVHVFVCKKCPGSFSLFGSIFGLFSFLFRLAWRLTKWGFILAVIGGLIFLIIGAGVLLVDWVKHLHKPVPAAESVHHGHKKRMKDS